jgi:large subunit ribosomal protein L21
VTVGRPTVPGAKVTARVVGPVRGEKIIVFKYKPKVRYRRKLGHRQDYTRVRITGIHPSA